MTSYACTDVSNLNTEIVNTNINCDLKVSNLEQKTRLLEEALGRRTAEVEEIESHNK